MSSKPQGDIALPGDDLQTGKTLPGQGTYIADGSIRSGLLGRAETVKTTSSTFNTVRPPTTIQSAILPAVGDVVLGSITRTGPRFATMDILAVTSIDDAAQTIPYPYAHQALVRQQDIRATEIDKVTVSGSFKVGDLVRATVISIGDERNYYVSTAGDAMGVVLGRSDLGENLVGVNWKEMVDDEGRRETRKAAKVV